MIPIKDAVHNNITYTYEMERFNEFKKDKDVCSNEVQEYVYKKGMELLKIYSYRIYWFAISPFDNHQSL